MSELNALIAQIPPRNDRLEEQVVRLTAELERNREDSEWVVTELWRAKNYLDEANDHIAQLQLEIDQLKSGSAAPQNSNTTRTKPKNTEREFLGECMDLLSQAKGSSSRIRTRIGIFTVAELEALGEEALAQLDQQVLDLSVTEIDSEEFERMFREAGLKRPRPEHYEFSEGGADKKFNDTGLTVNERNYYKMVQNCHMLVKLDWNNSWWIDRVMYRLTMMDHLDWRGMKRTSAISVSRWKDTQYEQLK